MEPFVSEDVRNKMDIVRKVVCAYDMDKKDLTPDQLFEIYTGYQADSSLLRKKFSYEDFHKATNLKPPNFNILRNKLYEWYLNERKPPTINDIVNCVKIHFPPNTEQDIYFYSLAKSGFVWKNIPGTTKAIFVETFENIAKRLNYVIKMKQYRSEKRHIVYLEDCSHRPYIVCPSKCFIAVSSKTGIIYTDQNIKSEFNAYNFDDKYYNTDDLSEQDSEKKEYLTMPRTPDITASTLHNQIGWLTEVVLRRLNTPCVFVCEEFPLSTKDRFTPLSFKHTMMEYLNENGIPFARRAHRYELYELIQKCLKKKTDLFTEVLLAHGHEVVLRPCDFEPFNFFSKFWEERWYYTNKNYKDSNEHIAVAEKSTFNKDRVMEVVIDKLMTLGKCKGEADENLPDYREVMKYEFEYGYHSMFVD